MFQAGASTWSKPTGLDKGNNKGRESQDEGVGILKYTTRIPQASQADPQLSALQLVHLQIKCGLLSVSRLSDVKDAKHSCCDVDRFLLGFQV